MGADHRVARKYSVTGHSSFGTSNRGVAFGAAKRVSSTRDALRRVTLALGQGSAKGWQGEAGCFDPGYRRKRSDIHLETAGVVELRNEAAVGECRLVADGEPARGRPQA